MRRALLLALFVAVACSEENKPAPITLTSGEVTVLVDLSPVHVVVKNKAGTVILETKAVRATQDSGKDAIKVLPGWDGYAPEEAPWTVAGGAKVVSQSPTQLALDMGTITLDIAIEGTKVTMKERAPTLNKTSITFAMKDDHFFGLGERFTSVDHRGLSLYSWAEEGGTGRGERTPASDNNPTPNGPSMTYFPVPFFLSSMGYGMHLATTFRTETHLGSENSNEWRVAANSSSLDVVVYVHDDPLASLDDFTRETGRPLIPAPWVFGPRRRVGNLDQTGSVPEWKRLRDEHVPTTGLDDNVHFLPARSELGREAELAEWTKTAHRWGFKVMAYNNPYVATSKPEAATDVAFGKDNGHFVLGEDGQTAITQLVSGEQVDIATIDLTKAEAVTWFQDMLKRTLALGYDGWMHDFGEYVRRGWSFADGRKGDEVHNLYPVLSAKAAFDLLSKERPNNDFLFFVRSGYTGTQQYVPAVWGGDAEATFDETQGLPAVVRGGLNLGMSGVPLWGSDMTGFKCLTDAPNDKEMYLRWTQFGAVSPIMMEQNACANPFQKKEKWKLWSDAQTQDVYSEMARLHTRLLPYWEVLAREAHERGTPIMRHPFLLHPKNENARRVQSAFYLGPSLYAAPVVERGSTTKEVWLPPGTWVELIDRTHYTGGQQANLPAPLDRLPLLIKDGGIVPMLDASVETLAPTTEPTVISYEQVKDKLDVLVALSKNKEARITLADGTELVARRAGGGEGEAMQAISEPGVETTENNGVTFEVHGNTTRTVRWDVELL